MATFVLVHGSWHGGWCWQQLAPLLAADGHRVLAPTLTGCGPNVHMVAKGVDLETHIKDIENLLFYDDLDDVILVGHSYAGMIIGSAAMRAPARVRALVYLDAYVIEPGKKGFDVWSPERLAVAQAAMARGEMFREPFEPAFLGITDPAMAAWTKARLTPHPLKTYNQVIEDDRSANAALPKLYIACTRGPTAQIFASTVDRVRAQGWEVRELSTGHNAMMLEPEALADMLLAFERKTADGNPN
jgi:pimeloyl-ACP methyl ester carboxylesterase